MTTFEAIEDPTGEFCVIGPDCLKIYCPTKKAAEELAGFLNEEEKNADWLEKMQCWLGQCLEITAERKKWLEDWLEQQEDEYRQRVNAIQRP